MNQIEESPPKQEDQNFKGPLLKQTLWVWFFTMLGLRLIHELQRVPVFRDYTMFLTALVLIYVPTIILWRRRERIHFFESSAMDLLKHITWFILAAVIIFPVLEVANRFFQEWAFHRHFIGGKYTTLGKVALFQLLLVALPEEFFYRGYLQHEFNRIWGRPWQFLGAPIGKGLLITSLIFAFSHSLIQLQWWHFSIFFPALVFGWLRDKTGTITASILFHALSNVYSYWIALNYH